LPRVSVDAFLDLAVLMAVGLALCAGPYVLYEAALKATVKKLADELATVTSSAAQTQAHLESEKLNLQSDLQTTQQKLEIAKPHQQNVEYMERALREMHDTWFNADKSEDDCRNVILKHPWVLWPDFKVKKLISERGLRRAAEALFDKQDLSTRLDRFKLEIKTNQRVDLIGLADVGGSIQPNLLDQDKEVLLVIELKSPIVNIGRVEIEQAYIYALSIMQIAEHRLWGEAIECLSIGKAVLDDAHEIHSRFGPGANQSIRVTPLSYATLLSRAYHAYDALTHWRGDDIADVIDISKHRAPNELAKNDPLAEDNPANSIAPPQLTAAPENRVQID
jgi:hypothetical protein